MSVAIVTSIYPPEIGGPSTQARHLAHALKGDDGRPPCVVTFGPREGSAVEEGVVVHRLRKRAGGSPASVALQYAQAYRALLRFLRRERPEVLLALTGPDLLSLVAGHAARRLGVPALVKYAGDIVWQTLNEEQELGVPYEEIFTHSAKARVLHALERAAFASYDLVWATSSFQEACLARDFGLPRERVLAMPNLVDLPRAPPVRVPREGPLEVLCLSRLVPWKDVPTAVRAFALADVPASRLSVVGSGVPRVEAELRALGEELGLGPRLRLVGRVPPPEAHAWFQRADLFLSASTYEPFGITLVEAMAAGVPVVATAVGGVPDVLGDSGAGVLVPPRDPAAMAEAIRAFLLDAERRRRAGEAGRARAASFDLARNVDRIEDALARTREAAKARR